jgi:RNA polymerase sigma-70 factor (ECF subfamily)
MTSTAISRNPLDTCRARRKKAAYSFDPFEMVREFGARVFAIAKHITQNEDDAGDVLIETFLSVCPDLDDCPDNEHAWLRLVSAAVRESFSKLRARGENRRRPDQVDPCEELLIRELFVWGDDYRPCDSGEGTNRVLEHGLASLDPMCRTVFVLKDIEGIAVEHIAPIVNRSAAAVEVCLLRARLRLGEMLTDRTGLQPRTAKAALGQSG